MSEESLSAIARAGEVVALVAPNKNHHVGLKSWRARFPDARVYAPAAALKALRGRYPDCSLDAIAALREQLPAEVVLRCSPHSKAGCTTLLVRRAAGWLWHTDDLVLNMDEYEGPLPVRWLMGLMRMVGGVRVNRMNRIFFVTDRAALKRELLADLETYPITALIPAHGVVGEDPELAARLRRSIEEVL